MGCGSSTRSKGSLYDVIEPPGPAAVAVNNEIVYLFARGSNNELYTTNFPVSGAISGAVADSTPTWISLGGKVTSTIAAAVNPLKRNSIDVFVRGADKCLWTIALVEGKWGEWVSLRGVLRSAPSAVATDDGAMHVFALGARGTIWRRTRVPTSSWGEWECDEIIGPVQRLRGAPTVVAPRGGSLESGYPLELYALPETADCVDGTVLVAKFNGRSWSEWRSLNVLVAGKILASPVASYGKDVCVFAATTTEEILVVSEDQKAAGSSTAAAGPTAVTGLLSYTSPAVVEAAGAVVVFAVDGSGKLKFNAKQGDAADPKAGAWNGVKKLRGLP